MTKASKKRAKKRKKNQKQEKKGEIHKDKQEDICHILEQNKYWAQRYRLFSQFDKGILLDDVGWYSVTPEEIASNIAERCRCGVIVDAFCGVGGNAIQFAKVCNFVIAIDIDPTRIAIARHNAEIYQVEDRIEFIVGDYLEILPSLVADVVFLSPPWGGPEYLNEKKFDLSAIQLNAEVDGFELFYRTCEKTKNIAYYLPRNVKHDQIKEIAKESERRTGSGSETEIWCELEEQKLNYKTKAVTVYFGDLVGR